MPAHSKLRQRQPGRGTISVLIGLFVGIPVASVFLVFVAFALGLVPEGHRKADRARLDLQNIAGAARMYERQKGRLPPAADGFEILVASRTLESIPRDPWGRDYLLRDSQPGLEIVTLGRNGIAGGAGQDQDLSVIVRPSPPTPPAPPGHPP